MPNQWLGKIVHRSDIGDLPMTLRLLVSVLAIAMPLTAVAKNSLLLDCAVTRANPLFDLAEVPEGAAMVRMERYRFTMPTGGGKGVARTPRADATSAEVIESEAQFQIDFENKRVIIDRMTAEFQVFIRGAQQPLGGGMCNRLGERRF